MITTHYPVHSIDKSSLLIVAGLISLYAPTYWDLTNSLWFADEQFQGLIVFLIVAGMGYSMRDRLFSGPYKPGNTAGSMLLLFGLLCYIFGRSQDILFFEVGSQIPVLAGTLLLIHGPSSIRVAWFPLVFLIFMIPLPGVLIDALTSPLKQWVSVLVEDLLYHLGYPIARNGIVLTIGRYQLLVADACSGLKSIFSLAAMGMLYIYMMARKSFFYNTLMLASIIPIAFAANFLRVIALVLITFYFGDDAGQGFLHGFASALLYSAALIGLFALGSLLDRISGWRTV